MAFDQSIEGVTVQEHDNATGLKKVELFGQSGSDMTLVAVTSTGALATVPGAYGSFVSGNAVNNSAGTAVKIAGSSTPCKMVTIFVPTGNTSSQVAIGDSTVKAANGSEVGVILISGSSHDFYVSDLTNLYFDVGTNGDKISFNYYN